MSGRFPVHRRIEATMGVDTNAQAPCHCASPRRADARTERPWELCRHRPCSQWIRCGGYARPVRRARSERRAQGCAIARVSLFLVLANLSYKDQPPSNSGSFPLRRPAGDQRPHCAVNPSRARSADSPISDLVDRSTAVRLTETGAFFLSSDAERKRAGGLATSRPHVASLSQHCFEQAS